MRRFTFTFLFLIFHSSVSAQNDEWLLGNWLHLGVKDPSKTELITFLENGKVMYKAAFVEENMHGVYEVNGNNIAVEILVNGIVPLPMNLKIGEKKRVLYFYNEKIEKPLEFHKQQ